MAVGILYFLHFSGKKSGSVSSVTAPSDLKIAYIKSDSVLKRYDYFKEMKTILEAKIYFTPNSTAISGADFVVFL